jgi:hypothetical protein
MSQPQLYGGFAAYSTDRNSKIHLTQDGASRNCLISTQDGNASEFVFDASAYKFSDHQGGVFDLEERLAGAGTGGGGVGSTELNNEIAARIYADNVLTNNVSTLQTDLGQEITDRTNAIGTHTGQISTLQTDLGQEITARTNADSIHSGQITSLQNGLAQEIQDRQNSSGGSANTDSITPPSGLLTVNGDISLGDPNEYALPEITALITCKTIRAQNILGVYGGEAVLNNGGRVQGNLTVTNNLVVTGTITNQAFQSMQQNSAEGVMIALGEESAARQAADDALSQNQDGIYSYVAATFSTKGELTTETNARISADSSLNTRVNTLETNYNGLTSSTPVRNVTSVTFSGSPATTVGVYYMLSASIACIAIDPFVVDVGSTARDYLSSTQLPANLRPAHGCGIVAPIKKDNSTTALGYIFINTSGQIFIYDYQKTTGFFEANSLSAGIPYSINFTYAVN